MLIRTACMLVLVCQFAAAASPSQGAEIVVIVSAKNSLSAMRVDQVSDIFLGQNSAFPDGKEAVALDQSTDSSLRNVFYLKVTSKSPQLLKAYWAKIIFTGRGQPPREIESSLSIRKLVAENPSLIGYIEKTTLDSSVKSVLTLP